MQIVTGGGYHLKTVEPAKSAQEINAAYGLVQGAFGDGVSTTSDAGHQAWEDLRIQNAAMLAARQFLSACATADHQSQERN